MSESATPDIVIADGLLLALLRQLGDRSEPAPALLKWAGPGPLFIEHSRFETGGAAREYHKLEKPLGNRDPGRAR